MNYKLCGGGRQQHSQTGCFITPAVRRRSPEPLSVPVQTNTQWSLRSLTLDASRMRAPRRVLALPRQYYSTIYTVVIPCKSTCKLPIARRRRNNLAASRAHRRSLRSHSIYCIGGRVGTTRRRRRYRSVPIAGDAATTHCIRLQVSKKTCTHAPSQY